MPSSWALPLPQNMSATVGSTPSFGHHRMHLSLEPRTQGDELGPIAHQLPQLPGGRRGDPRLRQPAQAQHVGQVDGVAFVVLDSPLPPVEALRVGQMDPGAVGLEQIDHPSTSRRWPRRPPRDPGPPPPPPPPSPTHHSPPQRPRASRPPRSPARSPTGDDESRYRHTVDP